MLDYKPYFNEKEDHTWCGSWYGSYLELWLHKEFMFKAFTRDDLEFLLDMNIDYQVH